MKITGRVGALILGVGLVAGCGQATTGQEAATATDKPAEIMVAIRKGPTFDQTESGFRIRDAESDFIWVQSNRFDLRLDPRFADGDDQVTANELRHANTILAFDDPTSGARLRCKASGDAVRGDFNRRLLTDDRIAATFRVELDACFVGEALLADRVVVFSGMLSLPRTK